MALWVTYDQVDWSYFGPRFNGTGFLYSDREYDESPAHFTIHGFSRKFGALHLHQVLWVTKAQFPLVQLRCLYSGLQAEQLDMLAKLSLVEWRLVEGKRQQQVEILTIARPRSNKPRIHKLHELAGRWLKAKLKAI
jgi:hypothetical protein